MEAARRVGASHAEDDLVDLGRASAGVQSPADNPFNLSHNTLRAITPPKNQEN